MKEPLKLGIVLMLYATVACVGLAFVYAGTKEVIEERSAADLKAALSELFADADSFDDLAGAIKGPIDGVTFGEQYKATKGGQVIGVAITATYGSYGGPARVLVGVDSSGMISRVKIMELSDTPGLGANASSDTYFVDKAAGKTFYGQFAGKPVTDAFVPKEDVIAITASTITSTAISKIVKVAGTAGKEWLAKGGN
ncbi:electron transport complex subunit G [Spirochaetia bacterium]|nr:electron transport complex subunit G [Spirochaetia bacterium]